MQLRRGILTSEFWVAVLTDVGAVLAAIVGNLPPQWAAVVATGSTIAYSIARALTKTAVANAHTPATAAAPLTPVAVSPAAPVAPPPSPAA